MSAIKECPKTSCAPPCNQQALRRIDYYSLALAMVSADSRSTTICGISFMEDDATQFFVNTARSGGFVVHRGPGISVKRAYLPADLRTGIFAIELWQRCRLYAIVAKKELYEEARKEFNS